MLEVVDRALRPMAELFAGSLNGECIEVMGHVGKVIRNVVRAFEVILFDVYNGLRDFRTTPTIA